MWWRDWIKNDDALRERREVQRLRSLWADLLRGYPWSYFVTLTSETERSPDVWERMVCEYILRLERVLGSRRWWWAYAIEGGSFIRPHAHLLVGGVPGKLQGRIEETWQRRGRVEIVDARDRPNAEAYIVKALELDYDHIDVAPDMDARVQAWHQRERHRARAAATESP